MLITSLGYELYILPTDKCNFSCTHCITQSSPLASRWSISQVEVLALAETVNKNSSIRAINFTGGEPSLKLNTIATLQDQIKRNDIKYSMTSNGSFFEKSEYFFSKIKLDELILSVDKFHAPFNDLKKIEALIKSAKKNNIDVKVNFVFELLEDIASVGFLHELEVDVSLSRIVVGKKAIENSIKSNWVDKNLSKKICPSFDLEQRRNGLEKVVYVPGKGFTPCCGPLAFENLASAHFIYVSDFSSYCENKLLSNLQGCSKQPKGSSIASVEGQAIGLSSTCQVCVQQYTTPLAENRNLAELLLQTEAVGYYPINSNFPDWAAYSLLPSLRTSFVCSLDLTSVNLRLAKNDDLESVIILSKNSVKYSEIEEFIVSNYYLNFSDYYSHTEIESFISVLPDYLNFAEYSSIYKKDDRVVGCLLVNAYRPHPGLLHDTLHIGYWGYSHAVLSTAERDFIKNDWIHKLKGWSISSGISQVDASFDFFNERSIALSKKLGFETKMLRLDQRY